MHAVRLSLVARRLQLWHSVRCELDPSSMESTVQRSFPVLLSPTSATNAALIMYEDCAGHEFEDWMEMPSQSLTLIPIEVSRL